MLERNGFLDLYYHMVFTIHKRELAGDKVLDDALKEVCTDIASKYKIEFLKIENEDGCIHFLIRSIPSYSPAQIVKTIKTITTREIPSYNPELKKKLQGAQLWHEDLMISTVEDFKKWRAGKAKSK